jgi:hypothetical protein
MPVAGVPLHCTPPRAQIISHLQRLGPQPFKLAPVGARPINANKAEIFNAEGATGLEPGVSEAEPQEPI